MRKRFLPHFLIFLILSWACSAFGQPPLKVGALIPFRGRWGDSGKEFAKGIWDAGKWLNQKGGLFGKNLEIILIEDTHQPAETIAAYRKLNEADRILVLYVFSPETAISLLPHHQFNRLPMVVNSFSSQLTNPGKYPYLFSVIPTPLDLSKIAMKFISERSGIKVRRPKVVFVGSPDHTGKHFLNEVKSYARSLGLEIGEDVWISLPSTSDEQKKKESLLPFFAMAQYNPDFAYLSLSSKEALILLQEVNGMSLKTKWICSLRAFDENLTPFEGVFGVQPISPFGEDIPGMPPLLEAHQRWHPYDSHTLSYVEGWASLQVIAEVLKRSLPEQGYSRERVKMAFETLRNFVIGGLFPPLTVTATDHRPSVESRIFIVKEGKLVRHTGFISLGR
jgi:branched-chain amino acid transport system substrate-binding protein